MTTDAEHAEVLLSFIKSDRSTWVPDSEVAAIVRSVELLEAKPKVPPPIRPNPGEPEWIPYPPRWVRKAHKRGYDVVERRQTCP